MSAPFDLSSIPTDKSSTAGFVILTEANAKLTGLTVSAAGDFNDDGFDDVIVVSPETPSLNGTTVDDFGRAYIIMGGASLGPIALSDVAVGVGGIMIQNDEEGKMPDTGGFSGRFVSSGDVNGDGISDVVIAVQGAQGVSSADNRSGEVHVIFGGKAVSGPVVMSDIQAGIGGFTIFGATTNTFGHSVAVADANGDGYGDVAIGDPTQGFNSDLVAQGVREGGHGWIVFGEASPSAFDVDSLAPPDPNKAAPGGVVLLNDDDDPDGGSISTSLGTAVASIGDFNNDGFEDVAAGDALNALNNLATSGETGTVHIAFGAVTINPVDFGKSGLTIVGEDKGDQAGWALDGAGDMNGDGFDDLVIGAHFGDGQNNAKSGAGDAYVVFGRSGIGGTVLLDDVAKGIGGFVLRGIDVNDHAGYSVAGAGDFNADGFDDIIIGAPDADGPNRNGAGEAYVVFGKASGFGAEVLLSDIAAGNGGFVIRGLDDANLPGAAGYSVDGAGDVNADGFDDVLIGVPGGSFNGRAYVVHGFSTGPIVRTGTDGDDLLVGGEFNDNLSGGKGADTIRSRQGNDLLNGGSGIDETDGGSGDDIHTVNHASDLVVERVGEGTMDRVSTSTGFALSAKAEIELFTTTSAAGLTAIDLTGNAFSQSITGNAGANVLHDGGKGGPDTLKGLGGNDTYRIFNTGDAIVESATQGSADRIVAAVSCTLGAGVFVETMQTNGSTGTAAINLAGNEIGQSLTGNAGNNRLEGKGGADVLRGLGGADTFVFATALGGGNIDTMLDFNAPDDRFLLSDNIFKALNTGTLSAAAFRSNTSGLAGDASDRIIYDTDDGRVLYDPDGTGGAAAIHFATLSVGLAITNSDFSVA